MRAYLLEATRQTAAREGGFYLADEVVTIQHAKTHLSRLVRQVEKGDEVVIRRGRTPVAKLVSYHAPARRRRPGRLRGKIELADDFDTLPEDIARALEGEP